MVMKKITSGAAVVLLAAVGTAQAQGVTLAGIADAGVRYVNNEGVGSIKSLASGGNSTSRLIIRGVENLGDGLSAAFHLESGFLMDTGTQSSSTAFWDRRATLSLVSQTMGEIRAGRDYVPTYLLWNRTDPFSYIGVAGASNFVSATPTGPIRSAFGTGQNSTVRANNSVQWLAPSTWNGFEGGVMLAAGEGGSSANGQHKVVVVRLGYASKAFSIGAAAARTESDLTALGRFDDRIIAGMYNFGPVRVSLALRRFDQADARQDNVLVGAWVPLGPGEVKASFQRVKFSGGVGATRLDANAARQFGIGYVYNLSKRSALYTTLAYIDNNGALRYTVPGGPSGMAAGGSSKGIEVGVRHTF